MMKLSIIIPCYNEVGTIATVIEQVLALQLPNWQMEVIVVDDASTDGTTEILADYNSRLKVIRLAKNSGKGTAVARGLVLATGDFLLIQDADWEYLPAEIPKLLQAIVGQRSIVYGSRNLAPDRRGDLIPRLGVWFITKLINVLYGSWLTDAWTGYKLFPATTKHLFVAGRFESELLFTVRVLRAGYVIVETPIKYCPRPADQGKKIRYRDGFKSIGLIVIDRLRHPALVWQSSYWRAFICGLTGLWLSMLWFLPPDVQGDTYSYVESMRVLTGGPVGSDFVPNRLLTTFAPLWLIAWLGQWLGNLFFVWFLFNSVIYFMAAGSAYLILRRLFAGNEKIAMLGGWFFAGNYGILHFGPNYLMDIGGLAFYIFSLSFLLKYLGRPWSGHLYLAALAVGVGGLFKEYAFLGVIAIAVVIIARSWRQPMIVFWLGVQTALLALTPSILVHGYIFGRFGYAYADWLTNNQEQYQYASRLAEYLKAGGSLLNFLIIPFVLGLIFLARHWFFVADRVRIFISAVGLSLLPLLFWPAITQRILSVTTFLVIVVAGFAWQYHSRWWRLWVGMLIAYVLVTFTMDAFFLDVINLPF